MDIFEAEKKVKRSCELRLRLSIYNACKMHEFCELHKITKTVFINAVLRKFLKEHDSGSSDP